VLDKVTQLGRPFVLVNLVGGRDELVFDGNSFALDASGTMIGWGEEFRETLATFEYNPKTGRGTGMPWPEIQREASIFQRLYSVCMIFFFKTGGRQAIVGLSGGIDSALVASIAVQALGRKMCSAWRCLHAILPTIATRMPLSRPKSQHPVVEDSDRDDFQILSQRTTTHFGDRPADITEENIQSRIRGNLLMALSNKYNAYVLTTGNKTELALGYCTLYGDMCGALAVISDLSKSDVYKVARYVNSAAGHEIIPERIFKKSQPPNWPPDRSTLSIMKSSVRWWITSSMNKRRPPN
jgi:NAD+ synthetase